MSLSLTILSTKLFTLAIKNGVITIEKITMSTKIIESSLSRSFPCVAIAKITKENSPTCERESAVLSAVPACSRIRKSAKIINVFNTNTMANTPTITPMFSTKTPRSIFIPTVTKKVPSKISLKGAISASTLWWYFVSAIIIPTINAPKE